MSGHQSWSSGVVHANWVLFCGLVIEEGKEPEVRYFSFPREKVEVIDNWDIAGMCGTGSHDVRVTEEFVPEHHTVLLADFLAGKAPGTALHANPLYRMPGTIIKYMECMAVLNGALRGAAEGFLQMTKDRIVSYTGTSVATKPAAQMRMGRAFAALDAVDELMDSAAARVMRYDGSRPMSIEERAAFRSRMALVVKMSADGVNDILQGAGGNSFRDSSALQRFFRDVNTVRTHAVLDFETATELRGRIELGLDPGTAVI